jgi:hypothetical protein
MRLLSYLWLALLIGGFSSPALAYKTIDKDGKEVKNERKVRYRADCASAQAETDQNVNNVRARLRSGGDVWWDGDEGLYIVPNVQTTPKSSIFAGSVWLGGVDDEGNLKLACQDYRSNNNEDFWPGPLTPDQGTVSPDTCAQWDRFFTVRGENIRTHFQNYRRSCTNPETLEGCDYDPNTIPLDVKGWPATGNPFFRDVHGFDLPNTSQGLAGFYDVTPDNIYDPSTGDFPIIEIRGCDEILTLETTIDRALPDEMIFWIYNDAGGPHTASMGQPIRMEIQVQAFAYESDDELNNMTFQRYKLINRATAPIDSTFFAMWVDADLGCALDDYVGCDVDRSLAFIYNADAFDENCLGANGYQSEVPIVGVDYFRGPLGPKVRDTAIVVNPDDPNLLDTVVTFRNPGVGELGDTILELGMSSFTYYNNPGSEPTPEGATTDPNSPTEFYNYLTGSWRDGTPFTFGGSAYNPGSEDLVQYAFTEPPNDPNGWSMCALNLAPGDRRTIQASGPFRLLPGATNELIIGVVWTPNMQYPCVEDFTRILQADAIAQNLFDNCFQLNNGPDAPDLDIVELDRELVLVLSNDLLSNNYREGYSEVDLKFDTEQGDSGDSLYNFEGYRVYQVRYPTVGPEDLNDPTLARPAFQVDVKNGVTQIVNWNAIPNPYVPTENLYEPDVKVIGADQGVQKAFSITRDLFATGQDARLINHREYYYTAVAYGFNEWAQFNPAQGEGSGQTQAYIQGRRNIKNYTGVPRPIEDRSLNAAYGSGPQVVRLDGKGNQSNFLKIVNEQEVYNSILDGSFDGTIQYEREAGPLDVIVYNPIDVVDGEYNLFMIDDNMADDELSADQEARWYMIAPDGDTIYAEQTLNEINEQIVADFGFSMQVYQTAEPGTAVAIRDDDNGAVGASIEYANPDGPEWYGFLPSVSGLLNYVKTDPAERDEQLDPGSPLSTMGGGVFVPMYLADWKAAPDGGVSHVISPAFWDNVSNTVRDNNSLSKLNNVDIVLTSDKSKWSRCVIVESANKYWYDDNEPPFSVGLPTEPDVANGCSPIENFDLRGALSVGKDDNDGDGLPDPDGELDDDGDPRVGMGWFPGYAVDVETGKRLNIFFGENSTYTDQIDPGVAQALGLSDETLELIKNGRDMMWNPNSTNSFNSNSFTYSLYFGGQHYIYVTDDEYDGCYNYYERLIGCKGSIAKFAALINVTWAGIPVLNPETELLPLNEGLIPNEAKISLRVADAFNVGLESEGEAGIGVNNGYPAYRILFDGEQANIADTPEEYNEELAAINVVPNPYYGLSYYEAEQNTNVVKITNLPAKCTVKIFSLDGRFVRRYDRDERRALQTTTRTDPGVISRQIDPSVEWDLRNAKGVPVASGVYLIHIDAGEKGERVLKFFAINRQFDPSGF